MFLVAVVVIEPEQHHLRIPVWFHIGRWVNHHVGSHTVLDVAVFRIKSNVDETGNWTLPAVTSGYYIPLYLEWNLVILVESYVWWLNSQLLCPMVTHSHTLQRSKVLTQVQQKAAALKVVERTWTHQNYMVQWIGFHRKIETGSHRFSHYDQEAFRFQSRENQPIG